MTYSRVRARVMPTYASRRSSSSSAESPSERMCGKTPSSSPVRNTTGNSSPLAVCSVIERDDAVALVGHGVGIGHQGDLLEERRQRAAREVVRLGSGFLVRHRACADHELARHGDELGEVLDPGLVLRVVALLEGREVAAYA